MKDDRKVAIISGGMGGVGRAASAALAHEGYRVVVLYRNSSEREVADVRSSLQGEQIFMRCDVGIEQDATRVIDEIFSKTGRIDVAIHTAVDPIRRERILDMNETAFRGQFEAGFFGAFNFLKSVAKIMKKQKFGTLIGITSSTIDSSITAARMGAYTIGKIAMRGLLRELHRELSPYGIRVFAVAPELMRTRLNADLPEKFFEMAEESQGGARMAVEDVARAIVELCMDQEIDSGISYLVSSGRMTPL